MSDILNVLMRDSEPMRRALLSTSMETSHGLRSPLMAAAVTGDLAIYTTILKAIGRACGEDPVRPSGNRVKEQASVLAGKAEKPTCQRLPRSRDTPPSPV